jgi:hypothetical protein
MASGQPAPVEARSRSVAGTYRSPAGGWRFGHAQAIGVTGDGLLAAAADPRAGDGGGRLLTRMRGQARRGAAVSA